MAKKQKTAQEPGAAQEHETAQEEITLDEAFSALDEIIGALESRDITLEESFRQYQKGMELVRACNEKIDTVEKKMLVLSGDGETYEF